jgi:NADH-quinone oxidoreductase subunit F
MNPEIKETIDQTFKEIRKEALNRVHTLSKDKVPVISIGKATCGIAAGALDTQKALEEILEKESIEARIKSVGCIGHCYAEPIMIIDHPESGFPPVLYHQVTPGKAGMIARSFLLEGDPLFEHILGAIEENDLIPNIMDFPRFNMEERLVMEKCGHIDPMDINDYISRDGYSTFIKALQTDREDILREISDSGLRGRGGAGFSTGEKWKTAINSDSDRRIVICNADEGDPGAYMDRNILESNPHQLLEGIAICAHTIGAQKAIIYIRAEYPLAVETIKSAIGQAENLGLLGKNILKTNTNIEISVFEGSGAFVCGEETALIRSIEGKRGMPRLRPPYPAQSGLWDVPTIINNVKTFCAIPSILKKGASWYRGLGTDNSPGTAIFSIVGNVVHSGLVEIPMGVTLRDLIFTICGGPSAKKTFKAVQIGGPSGGCLPEEFLEVPIDFESLKESGAMMGSGGMVVMDEDTCMVNIARYFLDFTQKESCGKCTFCRIGTYHLLRILDRITKGEGIQGDLEELEKLSAEIKAGSLCNLGKTAPNPVITTLKYFRDEYEAHINEKRCPAGMCRSLTAYYIDLEKCARGCDACVGSCPVEAIFTTKERKKGIDQELCVKCGECMAACPEEYNAVVKVSPPEKAPVIKRPE